MTAEFPWRDAVFVGLGANLGDPVAQLRGALAVLARAPGMRLLRTSSAWLTAPWGGVAQADFINAVAEFSTRLDPHAVIDTLLQIERGFGRVRENEPRWGPRILDLDLLLDGAAVVASPRLHLPHPRMHERAFVLLPLLEIAPEVRIPGHGSAAQCLAMVAQDDRARAIVVEQLLEPASVTGR